MQKRNPLAEGKMEGMVLGGQGGGGQVQVFAINIVETVRQHEGLRPRL